MLAYLSVINAPQTAETLREELHFDESYNEATCKKFEGVLEKKWTGIARLQRRVRTEGMDNVHRRMIVDRKCR
jgi:platelet-activating factor acetylhydrolase IB subunit alpha